MLGSLAKSLFGSENDRAVKKFAPQIAAINALEDETAALTDEALQESFAELRARVDKGEALDDLLPLAFAVQSLVHGAKMATVEPDECARVAAAAEPLERVLLATAARASPAAAATRRRRRRRGCLRRRRAPSGAPGGLRAPAA